MNETEILESLEKINIEYEQKDRFKKYYEIIDQNEIPFTVWIPYKEIEREFIYHWLERWEVIPEKVIESIAKRYDYVLFYDVITRKKCFLTFLNYILNTKDIFSDDINIISSIVSLKENKNDFIDYLKNLYDGYRYQKNSNWVCVLTYNPIKQLKYIKNLLFLLVNIYKSSNCIFLFQWIILFYDLSVFNVTNYNKFENCRNNMSFISLVSSTHKYIFYNFLNDYCFKVDKFFVSTIYGTFDLVQELITLYSKLYVQIDVESILDVFLELFNCHYYKLNILQRVNILEYINYNIYYYNNDNCFDIDLLQQLYVDSNKLEEHISYKLSILLSIISILQKGDKQITDTKFIYYFSRDVFKMLDEIKIYCDLYEHLLECNDESGYFEYCCSYVSNTNRIIEAFSNIILFEKEKIDSVFFQSELQKKIIDGCILHIKTLYSIKDKYHIIRSRDTHFTPVYYINILMDGILLYKNTERFKTYMNICKTVMIDIEKDIAQNNTEFKRYLNRAKIIPEELDDTKLDAITMEPLYDPIILPTSKMIVNRDTIKLHLYENDTDPFTKIKFTKKEIYDFIK